MHDLDVYRWNSYGVVTSYAGIKCQITNKIFWRLFFFYYLLYIYYSYNIGFLIQKKIVLS